MNTDSCCFCGTKTQVFSISEDAFRIRYTMICSDCGSTWNDEEPVDHHNHYEEEGTYYDEYDYYGYAEYGTDDKN